MTVKEAYEHGKKAFDDGADINHVPGHYSSIEVENFQAGYMERQSESISQLFVDDDEEYELEDISLYEDDLEQ